MISGGSFSMFVNVFAYVAVIRATREPYLKIICKSSQNLLKNLEKTG